MDREDLRQGRRAIMAGILETVEIPKHAADSLKREHLIMLAALIAIRDATGLQNRVTKATAANQAHKLAVDAIKNLQLD